MQPSSRKPNPVQNSHSSKGKRFRKFALFITRRLYEPSRAVHGHPSKEPAAGATASSSSFKAISARICDDMHWSWCARISSLVATKVAILLNADFASEQEEAFWVGAFVGGFLTIRGSWRIVSKVHNNKKRTLAFIYIYLERLFELRNDRCQSHHDPRTPRRRVRLGRPTGLPMYRQLTGEHSYIHVRIG